MLKKIVLMTAVMLLGVMVCSALADTEDEIIAKYLQKAEKKREHKVGFFTANFQYGKLSDNAGYNSFYYNASSELATVTGSVNPHGGIYRSREIGLGLGMMLYPRVAVNFGFDYWFTMGTKVTVDQNTTFGTLEVPSMFVDNAEVNVYGINAGVEYYLTNHPDNVGKLNSLAFKVGAGGGYYWANWDVWQENDSNSEPLTSNTFGLWAQVGAEYPMGFFDMTFSAEVSYFYLNFSELTSYNQESGTLSMAYIGDGEDVGLNLSGPRGKVVLKKYIVW